MSTVQLRTPQKKRNPALSWSPVIRHLPLHAGDHLTRAEFERRYEAHPGIKKAELIEGVVYMPSPVRHTVHGRPHARMMGWLGYYWAATPGVDMSDNASLRLDFENELQPDALLRLPAAQGGGSVIASDGFLEGAPELIVEIAASSASYDLHEKKRVYARSGVQEYLVVQVYDQELIWFALDEGVYRLLTPGDDGILRSQVFPGLWLRPTAFWDGDLAEMLDVVQAGIASPEHQSFLATTAIDHN
jgi:Uma2 family endonuclease